MLILDLVKCHLYTQYSITGDSKKDSPLQHLRSEYPNGIICCEHILGRKAAIGML